MQLFAPERTRLMKPFAPARSALRTGGALGFGGQSWPRTVLAPDSVYRLPIVCANKSWGHSHFARLSVVA
jgi:hypothetical protein